jgi:predicted RNA-binding protein with PUA-like domain
MLAKGNRLSITPVTPDEWRFITDKLAQYCHVVKGRDDQSAQP